MTPRRIFCIGIAFVFAFGLASLFLASAQTPVQAIQSLPPRSEITTEVSPQAPLTTTTYTYTNPFPTPFSDNMCGSPGQSLITVPEELYIYSVKVGVNVSHLNRGDMEIHLVSPPPEMVGVKLIGQSSSTFANFDVLFDPLSPNPPEGPPGDRDHDLGLPYYEFVWKPEGNMKQFYQLMSAGDWTLQFCDGVANGISGQVEQWILELELGPAIADLDGSYKYAPWKVGMFEPINYTIAVNNIGALTATNATLTDLIPELTTYISGSLSCSNSNCSYDPAGPTGPTIQWNGDVSPSGIEIINFAVMPQSYGEIENIALLSSTNTIGEYWLSANTSVYPEIFYSWDFEGDDGGFIGSNGWEWGMPDIEPPPNMGLYLWGTNLFGNYNDLLSSISLAKIVDLTAIPAGTALNLQWAEWYALAAGDYGALLINGIETYYVMGPSNGWRHTMVDLSPYVGDTVTLEWTVFPNGDGSADQGWYIDDVSIHTAMPETDLEITKEVSAEPAVIGEQLSYTVTVTNQGSISANNVHIYDDLPLEAVLESITPMLPPLVCGEESPGAVQCTVSLILPSEAYAVVIDVTPSVTQTQAGDQIVNHAYVSAIEADANPTNNHAVVVTTLIETPLTGPQVYSVTPGSAVIPLTGRLIRIDGDNFTLGMSAYLGDYELQNVTRISKSLLEARVPNSIPPDTYDLAVVSPASERGILLNAFTVLENAPPTVTRVFPRRGLNDIPTSILISGENFSPNMLATLYQGGSPVVLLENIQFINQRRVRATVPRSLPTGVYDLRIADFRGQSNWLDEAFTVLDPLTYDDLLAIDTYDLWMQPPSIQQGFTATVGVNVRRQGGQTTLADIVVNYYRGNPSAGGILLGQALTPPLEPRSMTTTTLTWTIGLNPGVYTFYGVIDPENAIPEFDESNNIISRSIRVLPSDPEYTPIRINEFTINQGAKSTQRAQVYLDVDASGIPPYTSTQPAYLIFIEYQFIQSENDWVQVGISDWLPYETASTNFPWKLHPTPGIHYIQVWAADQDGNLSRHPGMAAINLFVQRAHLAEQEVHIYRYPLLAGKSFLIRLIALNGDVDLYVWDPSGAEVGRSEIDSFYDELTFSTTLPGMYQIEVEGYTSADYRIEIIPLNLPLSTFTWQVPANSITAPNPRGRGAGINSTDPGENIGLPAIPLEAEIKLPVIYR